MSKVEDKFTYFLSPLYQKRPKITLSNALPISYKFSSEALINNYAQSLRLNKDIFVCKVLKIDDSGIKCQLLYHIGPFSFMDITKFQFKAFCPSDYIPEQYYKKILFIQDTIKYIKLIIKEIVEIPNEGGDPNEPDFTSLLIMSLLSIDIDKDDFNGCLPNLGVVNKMDMNYYFFAFDTDEQEIEKYTIKDFRLPNENIDTNVQSNSITIHDSNKIPTDTSDEEPTILVPSYLSLLKTQPCMQNLSCFSNLLHQITQSSIAGHYPQLQNADNNGADGEKIECIVEPYNDVCTFDPKLASLQLKLRSLGLDGSTDLCSTLRKKQANCWALEIVKKGIRFFSQGKTLEANQFYNKALSLDPTNVEALVAKGAMYANMSDFEKAINYFQEATDINPQHKNARNYLLKTLLTHAKMLDKQYMTITDGDSITDTSYANDLIVDDTTDSFSRKHKILHTLMQNYKRALDLFEVLETQSFNFKHGVTESEKDDEQSITKSILSPGLQSMEELLAAKSFVNNRYAYFCKIKDEMQRRENERVRMINKKTATKRNENSSQGTPSQSSSNSSSNNETTGSSEINSDSQSSSTNSSSSQESSSSIESPITRKLPKIKRLKRPSTKDYVKKHVKDDNGKTKENLSGMNNITTTQAPLIYKEIYYYDNDVIPPAKIAEKSPHSFTKKIQDHNLSHNPSHNVGEDKMGNIITNESQNNASVNDYKPIPTSGNDMLNSQVSTNKIVDDDIFKQKESQTEESRSKTMTTLKDMENFLQQLKKRQKK